MHKTNLIQKTKDQILNSLSLLLHLPFVEKKTLKQTTKKRFILYA